MPPTYTSFPIPTPPVTCNAPVDVLVDACVDVDFKIPPIEASDDDDKEFTLTFPPKDPFVLIIMLLASTSPENVVLVAVDIGFVPTRAK